MCHEVMRPGGFGGPQGRVSVNGEESCSSNSCVSLRVVGSIGGKDDGGLSGGGEKVAEEVVLGEIEGMIKGEGAKESAEWFGHDSVGSGRQRRG